jgi:hypothetical protein
MMVKARMAGAGLEVALEEPLMVEGLLILPPMVFWVFLPAPALAETVVSDFFGAIGEL